MSSFHMDMCIWQRFNRHTSNLLFLQKPCESLSVFIAKMTSHMRAPEDDVEKKTQLHIHICIIFISNYYERISWTIHRASIYYSQFQVEIWHSRGFFFFRLFRMMRRIVNCNCICPLTQSHDLVAHSSFKILINL